MNIKRIWLFLKDTRILPGYYAKEGMKFIQYNSGMAGIRAGMKVVRVSLGDVIMWDHVNNVEFKVPLKEVKKTTLVRIEEEHGA